MSLGINVGIALPNFTKFPNLPNFSLSAPLCSVIRTIKFLVRRGLIWSRHEEARMGHTKRISHSGF